MKGPGNPHTEMFYYDIMLDDNAKFNIPLKNDWNVFIYVYEGSIMLDKQVKKQNLAILTSKKRTRKQAKMDGVIHLLLLNPLPVPLADFWYIFWMPTMKKPSRMLKVMRAQG